jgi:AraC family transcriptional regulator of adaptative response/methylated-DNA-[protein]-cysteine methyltransferase
MHTTLVKTEIATPLGTMIAIADMHYLYLLQFTDMPKLTHHIQRLERRTQASIISGINAVTAQLAHELEHYFTGTLQNFTVPIRPYGTSFQINTWQALRTVPYGVTTSYTHLAHMICHPTAHRAVANANGTNDIIIIIPCHRIVRHGGELGGYGAGVERKKWLIEHEAMSRMSAR